MEGEQRRTKPTTRERATEQVGEGWLEKKKPIKRREEEVEQEKAGGAKPGRIYLLGPVELNEGRRPMTKICSAFARVIPGG